MRLPPFALERYFSRYEFAVQHLLCSSDCESMSIQDLLALEPGADERFLELRLGYTESSGSPSLRHENCRLYDGIEPEQILVHAGAEEAIFLFMHAVLETGDHLIVHQPCYQSLFEVARGIGCAVSAWQAREENGWARTRELDGLIRRDTGHRPQHPPQPHRVSHGDRQLQEIVESRTARHHPVLRRGLPGPGIRRGGQTPAACDLSERAVSLGVMSKTYGLPGLRIGWIATRNEAVLSRMAYLKDYTTICSSAPSEFLAELALRHGEAIAERSRSLIRANLDLLDAFFARHTEASVAPPAGGPIAFPRLLRGRGLILRRLGGLGSLLLLPGSVYADQGNHFRIGFGQERPGAGGASP